MKDETAINGDLVQALAGPWAMAEEHALMLGAWLRAAQGTVRATPAVDTGYLDRGVHVIEIVGTLYKGSVNAYGMQFAGTLELAARVRAADSSPSSKAIVLYMDTPGGMVAGTNELAMAVRDCKKPTIAVVSDLCASAGYWVASQADYIIANETSLNGSLGTYALLYDWSGMFASVGVKAYVVRAGEFKGAAAMGTEITEKQLAEFQRTVTDINGIFLRSVANGRGARLPDVSQVATGQVWIAEEALSKGLIDGIGTLDEVVDRLVKSGVFSLEGGGGRRSLSRGTPFEMTGGKSVSGVDGEEKTLTGGVAALNMEDDAMDPVKTETAAAPVAATLAELKGKFADAGSDWLVAQLECGATMATAQDAYTTLLRERTKAAEARAVAAEAAALEAQKTPAAAAAALSKPEKGAESFTGVAAVGDNGVSASSGTGGADGGFQARLDELTAQGKTSQEAMRIAAKEDPDGRVAWVAAHNRSKGNSAAVTV
ncbi:MAG: S49 family peptidase [Candidatus Hydrogenedentes bacterium]|nr:S49 family peptidase [Candidatus Hydrogenedentota bacterium]